ncbi:MAG: ABC transporter permease subunit [Planctomycetes bacterium]|nr:ABC transporter permease subunit [Planctomycetota bacterium]
MSERLAELFDLLPSYLGNHVLITVSALALGVLISLPLAIAAVRRRRLRTPVLATVGVIQTIPSLALFALMFPLLAGLSWLTARLVGLEFSALGRLPTIVALTLYSMLPLLRNSVAGILDVDPAYTEAARGLGMTPRQTLWQVEIPLALPVMIAGLRTAAVWTVGMATLATPVGEQCLGNYIFMGLHTQNWLMVLFGCVAAAGLALVLDGLIGGLERAAAQRRLAPALWSGGALVAVVLGGLLAPQIAAETARTTAAASRVDQPAVRSAAQTRPLRIGSKTFTEQYILAELVAARLEEAGFETQRVESLGSSVIFDALVSGEIDCYVDYTGTIWANYMHRKGTAPRWSVSDQVAGWLALEHGVRCLGSLGFENAYGLAVRREQARELGLTTIGDLARHAPKLRLAADYEFLGRPEWDALRDAYGLNFAERRTLDPTFLYRAAAAGEVDVISAFTSDGRIAAFDLVVLEDPMGAIPPYDAVLLLSASAARRPGVAEALEPLIGAIDAEAMRTANLMVDRAEKKRTPAEAARFLERESRP